MSIEIDLLRYVGLYEEPAGSYQVDRSGTPGDFLPLPYKEGTLQAQGAREMLDPMTGKMRLDGHSKKVTGNRACTLNMGVTLHSHGLDLDGDTAPPTTSTWALLRALVAIMGGSVATTNPGAGTVVVATGTTTTDVEVTAGHGARFQARGVIACQVAAGSPLVEAREIDAVAGDIVTVKMAFSAAPVTGSAVRGGVTVYLTENPSTSLQAHIEGREGTDGAVYRGLQGGFSLDLPVGQLGTISFALAGASWDRLGASSITIPTYSIFEAIHLAPLELCVPTLLGTARVVVDEASLSIEPQIVYAPQKSGRATDSIARMRRQPARPIVKGSFVCPYEDDTWYDARENREDRAVFAQLGALPGGTILVSAPTVQIVDWKGNPSDTGNAGQTVTWEGRHDELDTSLTTELGYSALRLHFV